MARPPLLTLSAIGLTFGGDPLLSGLDLVLQPGLRAALVGRNGSGKTTLLKIMAGLLEPDSGQRVLSPGVSVGNMEQDPDFGGFGTLGDYAASGLAVEQDHLVGRAAEKLKLDLTVAPDLASGGEKRRAALVKILAEDPDLLLLDEPTNHLDIAATLWLEDYLAQARKSFVLISHDRAFLRTLTGTTLWVDRGVVRRRDRGFADFENWRDRVFDEEDQARHKLNRLIKSEGRWAVEGISARRKRNQGRVRRLADLRSERSGQIMRQGVAKLELGTGQKSGKLVIEAKDIQKDFDQNTVLQPFSIKIARGERVAIVGPNGAGKTTLVNMLTGKLTPDAGLVRLGSNLRAAEFDQNRTALDPDASLWDSLTGDKSLGISGRNDQIMVRGRPRHVVGYLKEFLFDESQARGPVRALSGGEKARLLLARILARESNLLVLDEPTNDLDVETLDLLQEILDDYDGTVLLVSHDRDFLDRVASTTIAMEGGGSAVVYAGGWTDYQAQRGDPPTVSGTQAPAKKPKSNAQKTAGQAPVSGVAKSLTYVETHRLQTLPDTIARLEAEIAKLEVALSDQDLFNRAPDKFAKISDGLVERQAALVAAEEDWLDLAERSE